MLFPLCDIFSFLFYIQLILREWTCMSLVTSETLWQIYIWYSIHPLQQSFTKDQNIFTEVLFLCLLVSAMAVFILGIQPLELISLICRCGSFCHTFYNSHSLMDCASGSFIKPPVCFQINSWHLCKLVFRCCWVLLAMDYNVKKRKKGVVASNQECILRPAEPQAISCVLVVRQDG